ncbi:MAG: RNA polymerase subunit sigma, partial [Candidatus Eremiobacteraeota bacterium]|nr:RNA polymerase subunit sigma [Candidatus Eremiobacteraeota bacterium]
VARAVRELRGDRRSLLIEAFWNGASHRAIAAAVCLPLGTVKTRIRSGIAELRLKAVTAP